MKYLKTKLINESDYYQSISHNEYIDLLKRRVNINEVDFISNAIRDKRKLTMKDIAQSMDPYGINELEEIRKAANNIGLSFNRSITTNEIYLKTKGVLSITSLIICKIEDDWYLVSSPSDLKFYKCDQLDGLIEFLKSQKEMRNRLDIVNESYSQSYFNKIDMATFIREVDNYNGPHQEGSWNIECMTVSEIEYLTNLCSSLGLKNWNPLSRSSFDFTINGKKWYVYKKLGGDEWFYVTNTTLSEFAEIYPSDFEGYKCDQLDGIKHFIECKNAELNESISNGEKLCISIEDDEYTHWKGRIIGCPNKRAIDIIKDQIDEIESLKNNRFYESKLNVTEHKLTYNGNPLYGPSFDDDSYLKMSVAYCGDEWYLVECYYDYIFYTFLCDDLIGLEELSSELISKIEQDF